MSSLSQTPEPIQKRRKIRKGTFSCWECKNRKIRCQFTPSSATVCAFCQRRRLSCISQECPRPPDPGYQAVEQRIDYVEGLVAQLIQQKGPHLPSQRSPVSQEVNGDLFVDTIDPRVLHLPKTGNDATAERGPISSGSLSYVQSLLPSAAVIRQILDRNTLYVLPFHLLISSTARGKVDHRSASESNQLVHVVKRIIQLALCLQQPTQKFPELQFDQPGHQMAHYFVGSLRDARILYRRALGIARLLGLPCRQHEHNRAESLWFRLVYSDRFLSLMLGVPFVDVDCQRAGTRRRLADQWSDQLEQIHVVVVGRIIARNLRMQQRHVRQHEPLFDDYQETKDIDLQLKRAGRIPPARWWASPLLGNQMLDVNSAEQFIRILTQIHQFYLLVVLHQPYLIDYLCLRSTTHRQMPPGPAPNHTYSKLAILYASREVLAHFSIFGNALQKIPYRGFVEKAFSSAMCLLLIHMDGHRLQTEDALEHQRPGDLAVIDYVIHAMEEVYNVYNDNLTQSYVKILFTLVRMEDCAANGAEYLTQLEPETLENNNTQASIEDQRMSFPLPYFGRFHISREMST
ncbi:unnamed protein product [Penicillium glandicola]